MTEYTEAHATFDRILTDREAETPKTTPQLSLSLAIAYEMARESDMTVREARSVTVGVFEAIQRHGFKVTESTDHKTQNPYPGVTVKVNGSAGLYEPSEPPPGSRVIDGLGQIWQRDAGIHAHDPCYWRLDRPDGLTLEDATSWERVLENLPVQLYRKYV